MKKILVLFIMMLMILTACSQKKESPLAAAAPEVPLTALAELNPETYVGSVVVARDDNSDGIISGSQDWYAIWDLSPTHIIKYQSVDGVMRGNKYEEMWFTNGTMTMKKEYGPPNAPVSVPVTETYTYN